MSGLLATITTSGSAEAPAAGATPAVAEEEMATLRAECDDLQRQVKELKEAKAALQTQLATTQREAVVAPDVEDLAKAINNAQTSESALALAKRDLDGALGRERRLKQKMQQDDEEYNQLYHDYTALDTERCALRESLGRTEERVKALVLEKGAATKEAKHLRHQLDAHAQKVLDVVPLDAFSNTLDQISEAQVLSSVEGVNEAISDFLSELSTFESAPAPSGEEHHEPSCSADERLLWHALRTPGLNDEHRGLLLEAFLRTVIVGTIHSFFFTHDVLSASVAEAHIMDQLYAHMRASGGYRLDGVSASI
jgi:myosin heavy subunit